MIHECLCPGHFVYHICLALYTNENPRLVFFSFCIHLFSYLICYCIISRVFLCYTTRDLPVRVGDITVTSAPAAKEALAEQLVGGVCRGPVRSLLGVGRNLTNDRGRLHPRRTDKGSDCQHPEKISPGKTASFGQV